MAKKPKKNQMRRVIRVTGNEKSIADALIEGINEYEQSRCARWENAFEECVAGGEASDRESFMAGVSVAISNVCADVASGRLNIHIGATEG